MLYAIMGLATMLAYATAELVSAAKGQKMDDAELKEIWDRLDSGISHKVSAVLSYLFIFIAWPIALPFLIWTQISSRFRKGDD